MVQSVVKSFAFNQHIKWRFCTFNVSRTTESIFTITNRNNLHYSQTFYFQVSDFEKVFPAKFTQLSIFSKSTNLSSDEMKSANINFRYFILVICYSFVIYMGYQFFGVTDVIHLLGFPAFIKFCLFLSKFMLQRDVKLSRCSPNSSIMSFIELDFCWCWFLCRSLGISASQNQ